MTSTEKNCPEIRPDSKIKMQKKAARTAYLSQGRRRSTLQRSGKRKPNHTSAGKTKACTNEFHTKRTRYQGDGQNFQSRLPKAVSGNASRRKTSHAFRSRGRAATTQYPMRSPSSGTPTIGVRNAM